MNRFTLDYYTEYGKRYICAKGVLRELCIDKLGIIEDMIDSGEIPKKIADKIEKKLKGRFNNADL